MSGWNPTTVGELVSSKALEFGDGYRTKRSEHGQPGFRIIRVADVAENVISFEGPDFVSGQFGQAIGAKAGQAGDILLTTKGTVGRVAVMPEVGEPVVYSPQLCYFRVKEPDVIDPRFMRFWFSSPEFWNQAADRMNNTDMAAYINMADIRSLKLSLPSVDVQQAIAEVLGALDDKIAANTKLITLLDQLFLAEHTRQSLGDRTVSVALSSLLGDVIGGDWGSTDPSDIYSEAVRCIRGADIESLQTGGVGKMPTRFIKSNSLKRRNLAAGDIIVEMSGGSPTQSTGRPVLISDALAKRFDIPLMSSNFCRIVRLKNPATAHFVYGTLRKSWNSGEFFQFENGSTGIKNLAFADYCALKAIQIPDDNDLVRFNELANTTLGLMQSIGAESDRLAATRDVLLPQLMSGKLRVKDAEALVSAAV